MSGLVNDYALIKIIETYPILYDKDLARGQKNAEMKDRAWKEVSEKLKASERACITRWKSLRDRFGKEYRRVQEQPEEPTNWDLFAHLMFLKDHYKHGNARNDPDIQIKFTPREYKTNRPRNSYIGNGSQGEEDNEDDINPEELVINQQLIGLVKRYSVLYDKRQIRDSKNLTAKNEAWRDISESLGITEELCYKKWKKLRDRFSREYRYQKISPDKPVTWVYFQDLMFLEEHYRKGIPLNVKTLKRRGRPPATENSWSNDYSMDSCSNLKDQIVELDESNDIVIDSAEEESHIVKPQSLDDLIIIPEKRFYVSAYTENATATPTEPATTFEEIEALVEPEEKLTSVIASIETALRSTQDCLQTLQQQKERHKAQLKTASNAWQTQPTMLQKVHLLLDGLDQEERNKAERKILQFLCECQIKALNNEEIEDVCNVQIY